MDFSSALDNIKSGFFLRRKGWNGKGMYVAIQHPDANSANTLPYIWIKTADSHRVPWLPSQADLFADDWEVVN